MSHDHPIFGRLIWLAALVIICGVSATVVVTNTTLRSIEKNLPVALLNELNERIAFAAGEPSFRLQVNSILRTVRHQRRLDRLGYFAPRRSVHTAGYAVDVEKDWYSREAPRLHRIIRRELARYQRNGILNVIDEGAVWHICLNPEHIPHYGALIERGRIRREAT